MLEGPTMPGQSQSQRQQNDCPLAHFNCPSLSLLLTLSHSCAACCSFRRQLNSHLFCSFLLPPAAFEHSKEPNTLLSPPVPAPRFSNVKSRLPTRVVICVIYTYGKDLQSWQRCSVCKVSKVYDFIVSYVCHNCKDWQLHYMFYMAYVDVAIWQRI